MITLITSLSDILVESVIGILVVFIALSLLVMAFIGIGKFFKFMVRRNFRIKTKSNSDFHELTVYDAAAVSLALHMYLSELHDEESGVLTIKRIERRYSPWSSKIYAVNALK
jgi:Na+-transporting methylmalonyl-CoA/oxaloacetate decarboxylase gamma subunit